MRRFLGCLMVLCLLVTCVPVHAADLADTTYGYIGDTAITWELSDGILEIGGYGEAPIFASTQEQPWAGVRDEIAQVVFTNPGSASFPNLQYYFTDCENLTRAEVPYTASIIGADAYAGCPKLEEILFYYYDSDVFEIVEGAFATSSYMDTTVYLISEQVNTFKFIEDYTWSDDNRHATFYDVYTQEILGCGMACPCDQSVCSLRITTGAYAGNGKHYVIYKCTPCNYQEVQGTESCSGDPCSGCGYSSTCSRCGYDPCRCCTICNRYPCICCQHTSTYTQTSGCTVTTYCNSCSAKVSTKTSHKSLSTTYTYYNTSYHTQKTVCSSCSTTTVNQRYAHSTSVKYYDASYHGTYCTACSSWITKTTAHSTTASYSQNNASVHNVSNYCSGCKTTISTTTAAHVDTNADGKCDHCSYLMQVTITWNVEGNLSSTAQTIGAALTLPTPPTKAGYTFTGWFTAPSGGAQVTSSSTVPSVATTYYAQWRVNSYTITWDYGDGTYTTTQVYGTSMELPTSTPHKPNSHFGGWWTATSGGSVINESVTYLTDSDVTYYAQWVQAFSVTVPTSVAIVVDPAGGTVLASSTITNSSTGSVTVSSVSLNALNGWSFIPYNSDMSTVQVDSKVIGLELGDIETTVTGTSQTLTTNWVIAEGATLTLSGDAVVSAMSQAHSDEAVLEIVFVVSWTST